MAMTATISMVVGTATATSAVTEIDTTAIIVVSNSSAAPVNVTQVLPYVQSTGGSVTTTNSGVSIGVVNMGPNTNMTVPASGSLNLTVPITFHAPTTGYLSNGTNTYSVGATIYSNDGSVFIPTATTFTVNYVVSYPTAQQ